MTVICSFKTLSLTKVLIFSPMNKCFLNAKFSGLIITFIFVCILACLFYYIISYYILACLFYSFESL